MKLTETEVSSIIEKGSYYLVDDYAGREELVHRLMRTFLDGVERLAGPRCREHVSRDGLGRLHRHFPISKIHRLEAYLMNRLSDDLYYWSYRVGRETLGLDDPFYVDHLIVFRIHYPYLQARTAGDFEAPPFAWKERMRLAAGALRDPARLGHVLRKRGRVRRARESGQLRHDPFAYHGSIPLAARSHGPHIDTWYGHSYDGINLWLSIDGVNEDNTVIVYPEMFGRPMRFDPVSMYVARGVPLPPPRKIAPAPGQLLVFNPEVLHGTQVNISEETRVALTTRINPREPRFTPDAPFHMEHWYSSEDLGRRRFSAVRVFPAHRYPGRPSMAEQPAYVDPSTRYRTIQGRLERGTARVVCRVEELGAEERIAVDFDDARILIVRFGDGLRAYSRVCPHLGIDLADGSHGDGRMVCPGHGIAFSVGDGRSKCEAFRLKPFRAWESDGEIHVQREVPEETPTEFAPEVETTRS